MPRRFGGYERSDIAAAGRPIQRLARDAQAISLHSLLLPSMNIELLGRTLFGLEPNSFPL